MLARPLLIRVRLPGMLFAGAFAAGAFAACSTDPASSGDTKEASSSEGGATSSTSSSSSSSSSGSSGDPSDGGADGSPPEMPPNLLKNYDFEVGCANWTPVNGDTTQASVAHGGSGSCKVCMGTASEMIFQQKIDMTVKTGDAFEGDLWLRGAAPSGDLTNAGLVATSVAIADEEAVGAGTAGPTAPGETWAEVPTTFQAQRDRAALWLRLRLQQSGNPADAGGVICVYVDDALLRRKP